MTPTLRAEFFFDDETTTWHFRVPALHIIGGASSRNDAQQQCVEAIAFVLEGDPADYDETNQAVSFEMSVSSAA